MILMYSNMIKGGWEEGEERESWVRGVKPPHGQSGRVPTSPKRGDI